jgi:hypothetical protein
MMHTVFAMLYFLVLNKDRERYASVKEIEMKKISSRSRFKPLKNGESDVSS